MCNYGWEDKLLACTHEFEQKTIKVVNYLAGSHPRNFWGIFTPMFEDLEN